jgi:hypothetical protein
MMDGPEKEEERIGAGCPFPSIGYQHENTYAKRQLNLRSHATRFLPLDSGCEGYQPAAAVCYAADLGRAVCSSIPMTTPDWYEM